MKLKSSLPKSDFLVKPDKEVRLSGFSTHAHPGVKDSDAADTVLDGHRKKLSALQEVFYASQTKALLIVLQGMDTAGKDGTIRHIFSGVNPQGCDVASFKVPTPLEARHEFLWRCQAQTPARGMLAIFNRSHYEDVLSPVVHGIMSPKTARRHMDDINAWEDTLVDNDVLILKFFLHISQEEQTSRLQARIDDPDKHWKLSPSDLAERKFWPKYQDAYEEIFSRTSRKHAPWFIIPSDHKWFRNVAISAILVEAMEGLKLEFPKPTFDPAGIQLGEDAAAAAGGKKPGRGKKSAKNLMDVVDVNEGSVAPGKK